MNTDGQYWIPSNVWILNTVYSHLICCLIYRYTDRLFLYGDLAFLGEYGGLCCRLLDDLRHGEAGGRGAGKSSHMDHAQDVAPCVTK
jgi:hypothetical protein